MRSKEGIKLVSKKLVNYLFEDSTDEEKEIMNYGATILLSTIIAYSAILFIAKALGIFPLTLTALITASILKALSGGVHASCFRNCAITGTIIFNLLGSISYYFANQVEDITYLIWLVLLVGSVLIYFYSPAGIKEKPIRDKKKQSKLKIYSYIIFYIFLVLYYLLSLQGVSNQFILAGLSGLLWQGFSITPLAYKVFNREYINLNKEVSL
ncbi:accessory gene regulator ArgB-like protein [Selenihalanaerobacter shriftii]|uniref:Accessory gene regulator B n=1 Tax=Selenihalanaerobacter shriftii TaxID=142842 RepID=A0A1T4Q8I5_9FIRM|nr:accessory gene regulator B family protein [Selenihalanaerobacter shriftii]SKA00082.1 accessory gene regulator B [Selenihalanaerobacter shriftii]